MQESNVAKVDSKGRVLIPLSLRDAVKIREGMFVTLVANSDRREIRVSPLAYPSAKIAEIRIDIPDIPGALAKIAKILADCNVDLLASESRTLERRKLAEWTVVADTSRKSCSLEELERRLREEGKSRRVETKLLH